MAQIVRCPSCGKANRIPDLADGKRAVCGNCKAPLDGGRTAPGTMPGLGARDARPPGGSPVTLTDATFASAIRNGSYVVDFWAAWCGPCRMIAPILEELARERGDVTFAKLNVDENPRTAAQFGVQSIPLLVFFRDGAEAGRVVGAVPRTQIEAAIQRYLG